MITVGFLVGNVKVQTLFANRQKINQKKYSKNYQLIDRINKHTKKWLVQSCKEKTAKKSYGKSNLTLKDREAISITYQACKKIGISRKGMSRMIVDKKAFVKRKISVQQISAVISWLDSPKLRAKAVN